MTAARSRAMRAIRGEGTQIELMLGAALRELGEAFACNVHALPGAPDFVIVSRRLAIFAHGCFWHACPMHWKAPRTRRAHWVDAAQRAVERDRKAVADLRRLGWKVAVAWEHDIRKDAARVAAAALSVAPRDGSL